ncbi:hypothetical protein LCL97_13615 [Seohaeicola saemankumensis]|nr:hypothetical protein [Seohaeicola saemankumensis]MCA0871871.1 hypothetical protein [Seohaeicola saemankumensis]
MWQLQPVIAWVFTPQGINALFVCVSLAAALGWPPRAVAIASAVLYALMVPM